jgi:hypothetical protein
MSIDFVSHPGLALVGRVLIILTILNYALVEARWFDRELGYGAVRSLARVALGLVEGFIFLLFVGFLFTR